MQRRVFKQRRNGLRLGWYALVSTSFSQNFKSGKRPQTDGYQIVMESENKAYIKSKKERKVKIKLNLGKNGMFYLQDRRVRKAE